MNCLSSKYLFFEKQLVIPEKISTTLCGYDRFISAFNLSPRVQEVFARVQATEKHWLVFPEYKIGPSALPKNGMVTCFTSCEEDEVIQDYFDKCPIKSGERICIDSTGFIRPHLLFLLRFLYEMECPVADCIYSEPTAYQKGSSTPFSANLSEVRQVKCYEGSHPFDTSGEYLVVGCGYDTNSMSAIATHHRHAIKVQLFPFPPLRPHMYQENRMRTADCDGSFDQVLDPCFAPGYDPFATAQVLSRFVEQHRKDIKNLYLSPLATKAQVIGFAWFYLMECIDQAVSIVYPISDGYNQETSAGLSEVWRYKLDFKLLRHFQV